MPHNRTVHMPEKTNEQMMCEAAQAYALSALREIEGIKRDARRAFWISILALLAVLVLAVVQMR
jgi:hypothetical protein